jgi:hypothetical protein
VIRCEPTEQIFTRIKAAEDELMKTPNGLLAAILLAFVALIASDLRAIVFVR